MPVEELSEHIARVHNGNQAEFGRKHGMQRAYVSEMMKAGKYIVADGWLCIRRKKLDPPPKKT